MPFQSNKSSPCVHYMLSTTNPPSESSNLRMVLGDFQHRCLLLEQYVIHTGMFYLKSIEDHETHLVSFSPYIKSPLPLHRSQEVLDGENPYVYLWEFLDLQEASFFFFIPSFSISVHCLRSFNLRSFFYNLKCMGELFPMN